MTTTADDDKRPLDTCTTCLNSVERLYSLPLYAFISDRPCLKANGRPTERLRDHYVGSQANPVTDKSTNHFTKFRLDFALRGDDLPLGNATLLISSIIVSLLYHCDSLPRQTVAHRDPQTRSVPQRPGSPPAGKPYTVYHASLKVRVLQTDAESVRHVALCAASRPAPHGTWAISPVRAISRISTGLDRWFTTTN